MSIIMTNLPLDYEKKIGKPQVLARTIDLDGIPVLIRLQKPFEEAPYEDEASPKPAQVKVIGGKPVQVQPESDDKHIKYGACLIVETWCDATKSVITTGIKKPRDQSEEAFAFGVRYMMNNSTDKEIAEVLKIKKIDLQLKFQTGEDDSELKLPKPPKEKKPK